MFCRDMLFVDVARSVVLSGRSWRRGAAYDYKRISAHNEREAKSSLRRFTPRTALTQNLLCGDGNASEFNPGDDRVSLADYHQRREYTKEEAQENRREVNICIHLS